MANDTESHILRGITITHNVFKKKTKKKVHQKNLGKKVNDTVVMAGQKINRFKT